MLNLPENIQKILGAISKASEQQKLSAYLMGDVAKMHLDIQHAYSRTPLISVVVSGSFDVDRFYRTLLGVIEINNQIENTEYRYCFISEPYIVDIFPRENFDPNKDYRAEFTIDAIFIDLATEKVIDPTGLGQSDLAEHIVRHIGSKISFIHSALGFAEKYGAAEKMTVDPKQLSDLQSLPLTAFRTSPTKTTTECLKEVLLSQFPGNALQFIVNTFRDGDTWLFGALVDLLIDLNISLPENTSFEEILTPKKVELINVYSEFFLFEKTTVETAEEKKKRLTTTLRLLFDSPTLSITMPYIDRTSALSMSVAAMAAPEESEEESAEMSVMSTDPSIRGGGVALFEDFPECPAYGCPPCSPSECDPPCCCCHTIDYISEFQANCHEQVVISCNAAGDGPGPEPCQPDGTGCFSPECDACRDACDIAIPGADNILTCQNLTNQEWWGVPPVYPCNCECREGFETPGGDCGLTCVKCANLFCNSAINITGEDCSYSFSLVPGATCCGDPTVHFTFVIDVSSRATFFRNLVADQLDNFVDSLVSGGASVNMGIIAYGRATSPLPTSIINRTSDPAVVKDALRNFSDEGDTNIGVLDMEAILSASGGGGATKNHILVMATEQTQISNQAGGVWPAGPNPNQEFQRQFEVILDSINVSMRAGRVVCHVIQGYNTITPRAYDSGSRALVSSTSSTNDDGGLGSAVDKRWNNFGQAATEIIEQLDLDRFPTSCDCIDTTPIPARRWSDECNCCIEGTSGPDCIDDPLDVDCINSRPDHCFEFKINKCSVGPCDDPSICAVSTPINVCGNTVLITPLEANMVCCSDIGFGCDCPDDPCDEECCGPDCPDSLICDEQGNRLYQTLRAAQDDVWLNCWVTTQGRVDTSFTPNCTHPCCPEPESSPGDINYPCDMLDPNNPQHQQLLDDGTCCACASTNRDDCCTCCLNVADAERDADGNCGFATVCRANIDEEVARLWESCGEPPEPPPPFEGVNVVCPDEDTVISSDDCSAVRHPDTVVLNNGVGLVAYEDHNDVATIKIKQFKTSLANKALPNREFNFGRLEHFSKWTGGVAKLYYYDQLPTHLLTEPDPPVDPNDPATWKDGIIFTNGPLIQQSFPIMPPVGTDEIGNYLPVLIPTGTETTGEWPSSDDVYNIKWFLYDYEDGGLIGNATDTSTEGQDYIIQGQEVVDAILQLPQHIYNGEPVSIAYPTIATAENYSNHLENSHFVYLAYQALEDGKWNVYLRQLRLSEYERESQIEDQQGSLVSLEDLNMGQVIYKIVCRNDSCEEFGDDFLLKRTITFEVLLTDGREVFNNGLTGLWPSLCPGVEATEFPKDRVFVQFAHSAVADRCPDQFGFDEIFYDWKVGQEYIVPLDEDLTAQEVFSIISLPNDSAISVGQFDDPVTLGGAQIQSSSVGVVWYDDLATSTWSAFSNTAFELLSNFKGIDVGTPINLTYGEEGHSTRPVVKVNYNNDVYVVYESTETGTPNIKITGTAVPSSSLPNGYIEGRDIDARLNSFYKTSDFAYGEAITGPNQGLNQLPDMFIDLNDVVHVTWQSNRDQYWEIYYANSTNDFAVSRITKAKSKSLRPSIYGADDGNLFIAWHDDRHGNYEVFMTFNTSSRILPLYQQDPYLASLRNFGDGWQHTTDIIPMSIANNSSVAQCYSQFKVNFYEDRLLSNLAFSVNYTDFPFAFFLPDLAEDEIISSFSSFDEWQVAKTSEFDSTLNIVGQTFLATSPEIDTSLDDSGISEFTLPTLNSYCTLDTIEFRAGNTPNDPTSAWSTPVDVSGQKGQTIDFSTLGLDISGRYQQVRIKFFCSSVQETIEINGAADDAELSSSGVWDVNSPTIQIGLDSSDTTYDAYLRYDLDIPASAEIMQSHLLVRSAGLYPSETKAVVKLIDADSVGEFEEPITVQFNTDSSRSDTYSENGISVVDAETANFLYLGTDSGNSYESYLRYNISVPKGSNILTASIQVTPTTTIAGALSSVIYMVDEANVAEFRIRTEQNTSILAALDDCHATGPFAGGVQIFPTYANTFTLRNGNQSGIEGEDYAYLRFLVPNIDSTSTFESATLTIASLTGRSASVSVKRIGIEGTLGENAPDFTEGDVSGPGKGFLNYYTIGSSQRGPIIFDATDSASMAAAPSTINVDVSDIMNEYAAVATGSATQYVGMRFRVASTSVFPGEVWTFDAFDGGGTIPSLSLVFNTGSFGSANLALPVAWSDPGTWTTGVPVNTPDLSELVQDWLDRQADGYTTGNYMGFIFQDDGSSARKDFDSFDSGNPSTLTVKYSNPRPSTVGGVNWDIDDWSVNELVQSPDITTLVQSYVNRPGYSAGSSQYMGLVIQDNGSIDNKEFYAYDAAYQSDFDNPAAGAAALFVAYAPPVAFDFSLTSVTPPRLCLGAGDTSTGSLDITPSIRVDKLGNETTEIPLPIDYEPNRTYFTQVAATEDNLGDVVFPNPKVSTSCESCFRQNTTWNSISCSVQVQTSNEEETIRYMNVVVKFYSDEEKTNLVTQLSTFDDLECFTIDNMQPAQSAWTSKGFEVSPGGDLNLLLWPQLSSTTGLLCGIKYYVQIDLCSVTASGTCTAETAEPLSTDDWVCSCQSSRWNPRFEDAPVNIRELIQWRSSGFGFADTRLTETLDADNLNPIIRMRRNLNGVVIYETNRKESTSQVDTVYKIYSSVFSVRPAFDMYASAGRYIISPFNQVYHRSDIPICKNDGCFNEDGTVKNGTIEGRSPSFVFDQYDHIFMAVEDIFNQSDECQELERSKQQDIIIHRCGGDAVDLFPPADEDAPEAQPCDATTLVEQSFTESDDPVFQTTVRKIRVKDEDVQYHVTRTSILSPVVNKCNIRFDIVGTPESVAIRLRNGNGDWSAWYPFEPDVGENTMELDWVLTSGSGVKTINFQVATYAGLTASASATILADYTKIPHTIRFFKPIPDDTPLPSSGEEPDLGDDSNIWKTENEVSALEGIPVAAIRPSALEGQSDTSTGEIVTYTSDYIFVEIKPGSEYLSQFSDETGFEPTFDFINQGGRDEFNLPTIKGSREGQTVFRGKITIDRDGLSTAKDGLAFVIPHFVNDCSDTSIATNVDTPHIKDKYNVVVSGTPEVITEAGDVWSGERGDLGQIDTPVVIRPNDDPYFVFGDPNYRLKRNDE